MWVSVVYCYMFLKPLTCLFISCTVAGHELQLMHILLFSSNDLGQCYIIKWSLSNTAIVSGENGPYSAYTKRIATLLFPIYLDAICVENKHQFIFSCC